MRLRIGRGRPSRPAQRRPVVVVRPRDGVSAERVRLWMELRFQRPGQMDDGDNPLVNADITVRELD